MVCINAIHINIYLILASWLTEQQSKYFVIAYKTWYKQLLLVEYIGAYPVI